MNYNPHDPDYFAKMLRDAIAGIVEKSVQKVIISELSAREYFFSQSVEMLNEGQVKYLLSGKKISTIPKELPGRQYLNGPVFYRKEDVEHYWRGGKFDKDGNIIPL
jgi:hypothetical protein